MPQSRSLQEVVSQATFATPPERGRRILAGLLEEASIEQLRAYEDSEHTLIATEAFWERILSSNEEEGDFSKSLERFLGFLQGRLRKVPPTWWQDVVRSARVSHNRAVTFPAFERVAPKDRSNSVLTSLGNPDETKAVCDTLLLRTRDDVADMRAICVGADRAYLAVFYSAGLPFELYCFDSNTLELLWRSSVWATAQRFATGAGIAHRISIVPTHQSVLIFGATPQGVYVEGFDVEDGRCEFRFCTVRWKQ